MQSMKSSPSEDSNLENALRTKVQQIFRLGNLDELTIKRVRRAVEIEFGLKVDHFKDEEWRERSKNIIELEVVRAASHSGFYVKFS